MTSPLYTLPFVDSDEFSKGALEVDARLAAIGGEAEALSPESPARDMLRLRAEERDLMHRKSLIDRERTASMFAGRMYEVLHCTQDEAEALGRAASRLRDVTMYSAYSHKKEVADWLIFAVGTLAKHAKPVARWRAMRVLSIERHRSTLAELVAERDDLVARVEAADQNDDMSIAEYRTIMGRINDLDEMYNGAIISEKLIARERGSVASFTHDLERFERMVAGLDGDTVIYDGGIWDNGSSVTLADGSSMNAAAAFSVMIVHLHDKYGMQILDGNDNAHRRAEDFVELATIR